MSDVNAQALCGHAAELIRANRSDLAERILRDALSRAPDNADAHQLMAHCLRARRSYKASLREAREAIKLDPGDAWSHLELAWTLEYLDEADKAREAVREALRLAPREPAAWSAMSHLELVAGKYDQAIQAATSGLQIDPRHAGCLHALARAILPPNETIANKRKALRAFEVVRLGLAGSPQEAIFHVDLALVLAHMQDRDAAMEEYLEALRLDPASAQAASGLAGIRFAMFAWEPRRGLRAFGEWWLRLSRARRAALGGLLLAIGLPFGGAWTVLQWALAAQLAGLSGAPISRARRLAAGLMWWLGLPAAIAAVTVAQGLVFGPRYDLPGEDGTLGYAWWATTFLATLQVVGGLFFIRGAFPGVELGRLAAMLPRISVGAGLAMTILCSAVVPSSAVFASLQLAVYGTVGLGLLILLWPTWLKRLPAWFRRRDETSSGE